MQEWTDEMGMFEDDDEVSEHNLAISGLIGDPRYEALLKELAADVRATEVQMAEAKSASDLLRLSRYWQLSIHYLSLLRELPTDMRDRLTAIRSERPDEYEGDWPRPRLVNPLGTEDLG